MMPARVVTFFLTMSPLRGATLIYEPGGGVIARSVVMTLMAPGGILTGPFGLMISKPMELLVPLTGSLA